MSEADTDRIEKRVEINAPVEQVWQALTDHHQFGEWFRVNLEGPFVVGEKACGQITYPGYEHVRFEALVVEIQPMSRFVLKWHPYAIDPETDYSHEPMTTVEFELVPSTAVTVLTVVESGFDALPESRRDEAFRMNEGGWEGQVENITNYVAST